MMKHHDYYNEQAEGRGWRAGLVVGLLVLTVAALALAALTR
jgi:hypothetical protein